MGFGNSEQNFGMIASKFIVAMWYTHSCTHPDTLDKKNLLKLLGRRTLFLEVLGAQDLEQHALSCKSVVRF